ncbi:lysophospholipase, partial [Tothia fuscella]
MATPQHSFHRFALYLLLVISTSTSVLAGYLPEPKKCPSGTLVRQASTGLSQEEKSYVEERRKNATENLASWLQITDKAFSTKNLPALALVSSGGGYRSMLLGGGIVQAMDARESKEATKGLLQALTYHTGLSGGAWLLSSLIGNDYPTISTLKTELWQPGLVKNTLYPLNTGTSKEFLEVTKDLAAKGQSGYAPTNTDAWGRLLAYQLLSGPDGGAGKTLSSVVDMASFAGVHIPYPIITALGVSPADSNGICDPADNSTQYEFTPYEFGSWDRGLGAFTATRTLGSVISNGTSNGTCLNNYDNLGYILGTSSSKFQEACGSSLEIIAAMLEPAVNQAHNKTRRDLYAPYPNPFRNYPGSPLVSADPELLLVDGGQANQNNPIWPFLQKARDVDVLLVNDNSADTDENWPNGTEILHTYQQAKLAGLTRMPFIPPVATFIEKKLHQRATFFGCNDKSKLTIVFLPNVKYDYNTNPASSKFEYMFNETDAMINAGHKIITQNGDPAWAGCLGCAIVHKTGEAMPSQCTGCLDKYCFSENKTVSSPATPSSKPSVLPRSNAAVNASGFSRSVSIAVVVFVVALLSV